MDIETVFTIQVSEPWAFEDENTSSTLSASAKIITEDSVLAEMSKEVVFDASKYSFAICSLRHENMNFSDIASSPVPVNILFVGEEKARSMLKDGKINIKDWRGGGAAIGSISATP